MIFKAVVGSIDTFREGNEVVSVYREQSDDDERQRKRGGERGNRERGGNV
jgi:hypothetical protein